MSIKKENILCSSLNILFFLLLFSITKNIQAEANYPASSLLKNDSSIYYIDSAHYKHAFIDEVTYYSWFDDFKDVIEVSKSELDQYPDGKLVTIKAGYRLVTHAGTNKVYAVEPGGILRHIPSEEIAKNLYGPNWTSLVVDIPISLFISTYVQGDDLENSVGTGTIVKQLGSRAYYYIYNGLKRVFKNEQALLNNNFRFKDALEKDISNYLSGNIIQDWEENLAEYIAEVPTDNLYGCYYNQYSKNGVCINYTCMNNLDCDDNDLSTHDTCIYPGTKTSFCKHENFIYACYVNEDCNDNNLDTIDVCLNAAEPTAVCENKIITCGINQYLENGVCLNND
jgi:hypothetical protein